jgi:hypothetical protein
VETYPRTARLKIAFGALLRQRRQLKMMFCKMNSLEFLLAPGEVYLNSYRAAYVTNKLPGHIEFSRRATVIGSAGFRHYLACL